LAIAKALIDLPRGGASLTGNRAWFGVLDDDGLPEKFQSEAMKRKYMSLGGESLTGKNAWSAIYRRCYLKKPLAIARA
jgi:hypothetical protein